MYTTLSLSLSPFLTPTPRTTHCWRTLRCRSHESQLGQRWPIWWRRPKVSRGLFRLRSGISSSGYLRHHYTLHPTPPLRHVGAGLVITVSRSSKYDSPLSSHNIHARCTISFSNRCHATIRHCIRGLSGKYPAILNISRTGCVTLMQLGCQSEETLQCISEQSISRGATQSAVRRRWMSLCTVWPSH